MQADKQEPATITFSDALIVTGALFRDCRRPRLLSQLGPTQWRRVQARTPAVPEEGARYN